MFEEVLLNPPFQNKGRVLWQSSSSSSFFFYLFFSCYDVGYLACQHGMERSGEDIRDFIRFNSSLWASINRVFYNYQFSIIFLDWDPFWNWVGCWFFWAYFSYALIDPFILLLESLVSY